MGDMSARASSLRVDLSVDLETIMRRKILIGQG